MRANVGTAARCGLPFSIGWLFSHRFFHISSRTRPHTYCCLQYVSTLARQHLDHIYVQKHTEPQPCTSATCGLGVQLQRQHLPVVDLVESLQVVDVDPDCSARIREGLIAPRCRGGTGEIRERGPYQCGPRPRRTTLAFNQLISQSPPSTRWLLSLPKVKP